MGPSSSRSSAISWSSIHVLDALLDFITNPFQKLCPSSHLPGSSSRRRGGSWRRLLVVPGSKRLLAAAPCSSWRLLATQGGSWQLLLATSGGSWQLLAAFLRTVSHFRARRPQVLETVIEAPSKSSLPWGRGGAPLAHIPETQIRQFQVSELGGLKSLKLSSKTLSAGRFQPIARPPSQRADEPPPLRESRQLPQIR